MKLIFLFQGVLAGIAIAFPKGPAGLLVVTQTIQFGFDKGFNVAKGPILTTFISSIIILMLHTVGVNLEFVKQIRYDPIAHVIAGFFLVGVGFYVLFFLEEKPTTSKKLFLYTFFEPMLLPATIATFSWVSSNILTEEIPHKSLFFLGIIVGTLLWYILWCKFLEYLSKKGFKKIIITINIFFGIVFILLGMITILITNYKAILLFSGIAFLFDFTFKIG